MLPCQYYIVRSLEVVNAGLESMESFLFFIDEKKKENKLYILYS